MPSAGKKFDISQGIGYHTKHEAHEKPSHEKGEHGLTSYVQAFMHGPKKKL